jgi:hypothetical protein
MSNWKTASSPRAASELKRFGITSKTSLTSVRCIFFILLSLWQVRFRDKKHFSYPLGTLPGFRARIKERSPTGDQGPSLSAEFPKGQKSFKFSLYYGEFFIKNI